MTGFGHAQVSTPHVKATIEIKSLNHRYFDISFYLPPGFASLEHKIQQIVKKNIERGRVTVSIKFSQKSGQQVVLNKTIVKDYVKHIKSLQKEVSMKDDLHLSDIVRLPGIFEVKEALLTPEKMWTPLEKGVRKSVTGLVTMRKREGQSLKVDITDLVKRMTVQLTKIQARIKVILKAKKKSLTDEEFSSFQKSADISEEITRFKHYIDEVKSLLKAKSTIGKRIDFIAQEMQRETNTMGAKLQDKVISNCVITLKSKIEKIREQSQNIE